MPVIHGSGGRGRSDTLAQPSMLASMVPASVETRVGSLSRARPLSRWRPCGFSVFRRPRTGSRGEQRPARCNRRFLRGRLGRFVGLGWPA